MDEINFKNKYLKYKNKYLELKRLESSLETELDGGGGVIATYICFFTDEAKDIIIGKDLSNNDINLAGANLQTNEWKDDISSRGYYKIGPYTQRMMYFNRSKTSQTDINLSFILSNADFHYCSIKSGLYPYSITELLNGPYLNNNILHVKQDTQSTQDTNTVKTNEISQDVTPYKLIRNLIGTPIILPSKFKSNKTFGSFEKNITNAKEMQDKVLKLFDMDKADNNNELIELINYCNLYNISVSGCATTITINKPIKTIIIVNSDIYRVSGSNAIYQIYSVNTNDNKCELKPWVSRANNGIVQFKDPNSAST